MTTPDDVEANAVRWLRGLTFIVVALAILAVVLDRRHSIVAGALCVPSG